ncbi:hypothetical protein [Pseudomonas petrae]|uniref:Uncharacterized protein n=1 Tax=Pseudomonas petrae TaxID=2912190 RepID=A0ABS9I6K0_9PSED|nr:hypothetical protein [Pseudomonas petrae]MCF7534163.1 hypothetical protein [Pseudomonas petrae]MCF7537987.1 hypothetical protein [Pseudomonas petrae]MCF7543369.1 hypothetical protein [Pseudomonas petrae]MCF7555334.1 hypothetical protein [Pseudomonas petrae]
MKTRLDAFFVVGWRPLLSAHMLPCADQGSANIHFWVPYKLLRSIVVYPATVDTSASGVIAPKKAFPTS